MLVVEVYSGIHVVRDDLYPGGTKARYMPALFNRVKADVVYASPCCGGAQIALATIAPQFNSHVTIVCAKRAKWHPMTILAKKLGAEIVEVDPPAFLTVVQARAREHANKIGAYLLPFGLNVPEAVPGIAGAAKEVPFIPDEVWCASGSGTLARGLHAAWPNAEHHVAQVGHRLTNDEVSGAIIHPVPYSFEKTCHNPPSFPSNLNYDAKAWELCLKLSNRQERRVLFWNVLA